MGQANLSWDVNTLSGCFLGKATFNPEGIQPTMEGGEEEEEEEELRGFINEKYDRNNNTPELLELPSNSKLIQYNSNFQFNNNPVAGKTTNCNISSFDDRKGKLTKQPLTPLVPPKVTPKVKRVEYYDLRGGKGGVGCSDNNTNNNSYSDNSSNSYSDNSYNGGGGKYQGFSERENG